MAIIDGRCDGVEMCEAYGFWPYGGDKGVYPDVSKVSADEMTALATATAQLYCASDAVDGVQIDLEPFADPYRANLKVRRRASGCVPLDFEFVSLRGRLLVC